MKRKFTLLLFAAMLAVGAAAQKTATIYQASVDPVIDGEVDEVWAEAIDLHNIDVATAAGTPTLGESGETTWQALWTYDGIYVLVTVTDDYFYPFYIDGVNSWEYDKVEVYFDVNYVLEDAIGPSVGDGHYQVAPAFAAETIDGTPLACAFNGNPGDFVEYAFLVDDPTYIAEYFIPFSDLITNEGVQVDITGDIGFDVTVIDRDPGDEANTSAVWSNDTPDNLAWTNMDDCGIIVLDGAAIGEYVESVTLTGGDITENNGKLQIEATVLPADATNPALTWSVVNGSGRASVDAEGVVTGIMDGDVSIVASTVDGSFVESSIVVNISNQIVTRPEINLIRNGYFDDLNADNTPKEWIIAGETYVNEDGVCVIDPEVAVDVAPNVWDFRLQQQGGWGLNTEDSYTFSFVAWADESDTLNLDFEDGRDAVDYIRLGTSESEYAGGTTDWTFMSPTEPTKYIFDIGSFDNLVPGVSNEQFQFMFGLHDPIVYIDSVELINDNDLALLTEGYIAVEMITVSGDSKVVVNETLQLSAAVEPAEATLGGVNWKVVPGTGWASIDESGLLTGDTAGSVVVVAMAKDDSKVLATIDVSVTYPVGMEQRKVNTLNVYPNPAVNELNIVLTKDNSRVAIYNSAGMIMDELLVNGTTYSLDISNYTAGVYFVKAGKLHTKFVK